MASFEYEFKRFWLYDTIKILTWWTWLLWLRPKKHFVSEKAKSEYKKFLFKGGLLLASNHVSFMDTVYLQTALFLRHHVIVSAKDIVENMKNGEILKFFGVLEIDREKPTTQEFRNIVSDLKRGYVVNIFPEGGVESKNEIGEIKEGVVLMAKTAGVPIFPCYMVKRHRVHYYFGEPIYLDEVNIDKESRKNIANLLKSKLTNLKIEASKI